MKFIRLNNCKTKSAKIKEIISETSTYQLTPEPPDPLTYIRVKTHWITHLQNFPSGNKISPPHQTQPPVTDSPIQLTHPPSSIPKISHEFISNYESATAPIHKISNHKSTILYTIFFLVWKFDGKFWRNGTAEKFIVVEP